jgi:hypothetical protein
MTQPPISRGFRGRGPNVRNDRVPSRSAPDQRFSGALGGTDASEISKSTEQKGLSLLRTHLLPMGMDVGALLAFGRSGHDALKYQRREPVDRGGWYKVKAA